MMLKEYRICMPLTVDEYRQGQLYMIARHSQEQSQKGEGVLVVTNEPTVDPEHGRGQYTEKRIYLSSRLPGWVQAIVPNIFYVTEKAWNFYPYTKTDWTMLTYLDAFQCLHLSDNDLEIREICHLDIAYDPLAEKHYKESEDLTKFKSKKTDRGPLNPGWRDSTKPIMCSYKVVRIRFDVWGLQGRVESFTQKVIQDILLLGHRQAFAWIDDWYDKTIDEIRQYERCKNEETNSKVRLKSETTTTPPQGHPSPRLLVSDIQSQ